jgi:hypothetical protein
MQYEIDPISKKVAASLIGSGVGAETINQSLGIPLMAEGERVENLWKTLHIALEKTKLSQLLIVFVNERESDGKEVRDSNIETLRFFAVPQSAPYVFKKVGKDFLLVINGTLAEFRLKHDEGVGRARKVIADLALSLFRRGVLSSDVHRQTDGDAKVPADYLLSILEEATVAATYPFFHSQGELTDEEFCGLQKYERWLESYIEGLIHAGSRYAFWPLGSTLIFKLSAYEKVRGIPNVRAGEDFHFLSKLSKLGQIIKLKASPIELRGRHSTRVPFGTGRALMNMKNGEKEYEEFPLKIFAELKIVLRRIDQLSESENVKAFFDQLNSVDALFFGEFRAAFEKIISQKNSAEQKRKQLHQCFDGLKTMRWVNLRVKSYSPGVSQNP